MDINDKNETIKYLFELKDKTESEVSYKRVVGYSWEVKENIREK